MIRTFLFSMFLFGLAHAAGIDSFSPQGEVKGVRQVLVRFTHEMVPLGDPRLPEPFNIDCAEKGSGRWVDGRNWVYDFERDLPAGVRCTFTLKPDSKALDGTLLEPASKSFSTGGPAVLTTWPGEGSESLDENQIFILGLDAPVKSASLNNRAWCVAEGVGEKIPARLVDARTRKTVLENAREFFSEYGYAIDLSTARRFFLNLPGGTVRENILAATTRDDAPVVVLQCARRLPSGAKLNLVWDKGIESASGVPVSAAQTLAYQVRPAFSAKLRCEKTSAKAPCLPILPMTLSFTSPVPVKLASKISLSSAGKIWKPEISKDDLASGSTQSLSFKGPFPENANLTLKLPKGFKDDAGRTLANAKKFPLAIKTDAAPPLAKFAAGFGLIEKNAEPMLPLTLRATGEMRKSHAVLTGEHLVTQKPMEVLAWLKRIQQFDHDEWEYDKNTGNNLVKKYGAEDSIFGPQHKIQSFPLPKPLPDRETEVIGIPLKEAGFHIVEVASPRLGESLMAKKKPYHVRAAALVTNLSVHFKQGRESSLVWVTALDTGKPVAGVEVAVRDCGGTIHAQGKTGQTGLFNIEKDLPDIQTLPRCLNNWDRQYYVTTYKDGDFSFVLSNWNEGISTWRFNLYRNTWQGPYLAHAVLDRSLFRAGETVGMKLFIRRKAANGFAFVDTSKLGSEIILRHEGTDDEIKLPVKWDSQGIAEASVTLPREAKQGRYAILVPHTLRGQASQIEAGSFRVAAYRVPTMRATLTGPKTPAVNVQSLVIDAQLSYLSGGAASFAPVKLRGQLQEKSVRFGDYEGLEFANGAVKTGREEEGADWHIGEYDLDGEDATPSTTQSIKTQSFKLDAGGASRVEITDLPASETPRDLLAELEYRDANGETLTAATRIPLYPSNVLLAVKPDSWLLSKDGLKFTVQAVDVRGKPVAGIDIKTEILKRDWYSHRKRLIGGFYAYAHGREVSKIADACSGKTDDLGRLACKLKAPATGDLILLARAKDTTGNESAAHSDTWVPGPDSWHQVSDNDRMDLVPEKRKYDIGETARLRMALPFETATVLVSVEREGVLDAWVTEVKRDSPVIEVPIKAHYGPNVFVSALAVRGRIAGVASTAMVDLGKPAFRMGATEIKTGWSGHALEVKVSTDKQKYRVREQVRTKIRVTRPDGSPARNGEAAIAVIDEGLLELQNNDSWKLLDAMMAPRGIEVETSTAQMQVVGKRHYGRKAVAAGGGGGRQSARELFDSRVYWQARVKLDDKGEAEVGFPLNDSLTSFRIVAVASVNVGRFGTGETSIQTQQDLILQSGLAPVVREGDTYVAYITARNGADRPIKATVKASISGMPDPAPQTVQLSAGEAKELAFPVNIPYGVKNLDWEISATETGGESSDRMKLTQTVIEAVPVRTFQATLMQLDKPVSMMTQIPADAIPGRGGIGVKLQARLGDDLPGVTEYMSRYPWTCLEQQASIAVSLQNETRWKHIAARLPLYLDSDGLAKYWTDLREGSDTLTAYVLSIADEAGYEIPMETAARMTQALAGFIEGRVVRGSVLNTADLAVRKIAAMEALSRYQGLDEVPPFDPRWLDSFSHTPNLWPTTTLLDWIAIHQRITSLPDRESRLKEAHTILRSRLNFSGTIMTFSTERNDAWWWLMWNGDVNANRLLLAANDDPAWQDDIGRLVRGTLSRQHKGRWHTTVANAWGVLAMKKFSAKHEAVPVSGKTAAELAGKTFSADWKQAEASTLLPWSKDAAPLKLEHAGSGKPWATVSSLAAITLKQPLNAGYRIMRTITPIDAKSPHAWHRGDVYRVRLDIDAQTDMGWVAISDPIPSGATILGTGLGRDSAILSSGEKREGWVWPAYEERTHDSFRAYYTWVPKGQFSVEYTVRINNEGEYKLPATRVEAMYAPELFGEFPVAEMVVKP
ncbi:MAG: alpha-2-macroglobulin [Hydrogenophilaceae bacterium]|nr:alpha-2-macroglobulin [Hydrogenophilaceae bacterium]